MSAAQSLSAAGRRGALFDSLHGDGDADSTQALTFPAVPFSVAARFGGQRRFRRSEIAYIDSAFPRAL
eukprot:COSAG06_NODE_12588_length_1360_cov_1.471055_3_plen_67_part_01